MPLSGDEQATFAAIIAKLGNPERRRLRRMTTSLSASVLLLVGAASRFFHWPWAVYIAFCTTFVVAVGVGWAYIRRHPLG
jgi:uncharacterized membrane protein YphA (DoxX/SURF4 family)